MYSMQCDGERQQRHNCILDLELVNMQIVFELVTNTMWTCCMLVIMGHEAVTREGMQQANTRSWEA